MIFNQFEFLFLFLPMVLAAFYFPKLQSARPLVLVVASLIFYAVSGLEHAITLCTGILWVYVVTRSDAIVANLWRLTLAIVPPLLALGYYKYLGFFLDQFIHVGYASNTGEFDMFANIILPAGISFFTFQLVSFAIDRFRGEITTPPNFVKFALYISFFPQLVAGPILRFGQVQSALEKLHTFRLNAPIASKAIVYISVGLASKVLIADTLDSYQTLYVSAPDAISAISATFVLFAYSFQIYFDFYGYSMVAIGLGLLFGFSFPKNFNRPYEALNPQDFWRRWHMTLSFWIRDYLYFPLGGNKVYVRNIIIIFAVCGLWHGAGWSFIVWGLFHAFIVILYHASSSQWDRLPRLFQIGLTFLLVGAGWTLFQFDFETLLSFWSSFNPSREATIDDPELAMWAVVALSALICYGVYFERLADGDLFGKSRPITLTATCALLFTAVLVFITKSSTFIYFRF
jgi:alginate O-acetyltransferase complex protein AlgI